MEQQEVGMKERKEEEKMPVMFRGTTTNSLYFPFFSGRLCVLQLINIVRLWEVSMAPKERTRPNPQNNSWELRVLGAREQPQTQKYNRIFKTIFGLLRARQVPKPGVGGIFELNI